MIRPFDDRKCDHCGADFKRGQLFLGVCNDCLSCGHAGSGVCTRSGCRSTNSSSPIATYDEPSDARWMLNIKSMKYNEIRKAVIRRVLTNLNGNISATAKYLGIAKATIYRHLHSWERERRIIADSTLNQSR